MALYGPFPDPTGGGSLYASAPPGAVPLGGAVPLAFDGVLSDMTAVLRENQRTQQMTLAYMEQMTRFAGRTSDAAETFSRAMGVSPAPRSGATSDPIADRLASEAPGVAEPTRKRQRRDPVPEDVPDHLPFHAVPGQRYTLGSLRQDAAASAGKRLQAMTWGEQLVQDKRGNWYPEGVPMNRKANRATDKQVERFLARQSIQGGVQNTLGKLAEGEKLGAAITGGFGEAGGSAAKIAGGIGAVTAGVMVAQEAVDRVLDFSEGQREANRNWQKILGGSNAEGFGERARSQLNEWGGRFFGGVPTSVSEDAYFGAAQVYGRDRNMRGQAYDFTIEMYKKLGLDVSESLKLVGMAAESNNDNLDLLAEKLKALSQAAGDAGISAEKARESFERNFAANTANVGGTQATMVSAMYAAFEDSMGLGYTDVSYAGALSGSALQARAAARGMTTSAYRAMVASPGGAAEEAKTVQLMTQERIGAWLPEDARVKAQQWIAAHGGMDAMTGEKWTALANELAQTTSFGNLSPEALQNLLGQDYGIDQTSPDNVGGMFLRTMLDSDRLAEMASDVIGETTPQPIAGQTQSDIQAEIDSLEGTLNRLGPYHSQDKAYSQIRTRLAALKAQQATGATSPIIEALASDQYDKDRRYTVMGSDGKEVEVNTEELLSKYSDQAMTGDVEISRGAGAGQTVSEYTGVRGGEPTATTVRIFPHPILTKFFQFIEDPNLEARTQGVPPRSGP